MSMSRRRTQRQQELWINTANVITPAGHPFYRRLNQLLERHQFDPFVEGRCEPFYATDLGRPSIPPGVYFRMLLVGYFEDLGSERGIAWRCADSLGLRAFLGYGLNQKTPEHSSLSKIRGRINVETHGEVFQWVLRVLAQSGLLKGKAPEQAAVYGNRRRIRGQRGKALLRKRGELLERPFAHCYETGGLRRTHLKGHARILKRLLIHVAGCNLALVMRTLFGSGTPRGLQGLARDLLDACVRLICDLRRFCKEIRRLLYRFDASETLNRTAGWNLQSTPFSTAC